LGVVVAHLCSQYGSMYIIWVVACTFSFDSACIVYVMQISVLTRDVPLIMSLVVHLCVVLNLWRSDAQKPLYMCVAIMYQSCPWLDC
jgi:hypothetical protein